MKGNLILYFLTLSGIFSSQAQSNIYHPFPENGAIWNYGQQEPCHILLVYHSYSLVLDSDTIIGSNTYHKLNIPYVNTWSQETGCPPFYWGLGYQGGIRQDTSARKVYYISPSDSIEQVLYDFSLQVGDSVYGRISPWSCAVVSAIDSMQFPDGWRKKWHYSTDAGLEEIVEGVGNIHYGLLDIICLLLDNHKSDLWCFSQNGQTIYPDSNAQCDIIDEISLISKPANSLNIFPNPAINHLTIQYAAPMTLGIEIYNSLGIKVFSASAIREPFTVNCEQFPAGIYFIKALAGEKVLFGKIIKE